MQVVDVDVVGVEATKALLDLTHDVVPAEAATLPAEPADDHAAVVRAGADGLRDLRAQHDLVATTLERLSEQLLGVLSLAGRRKPFAVERGSAAVGVRAVEQVDACVERGADQRVDAVLGRREAEHGGARARAATPRMPVRPMSA